MYAIRAGKYASFVQVEMVGTTEPSLDLDYGDRSFLRTDLFPNDRIWVGEVQAEGSAMYVTEDIEVAKATLSLLEASDDTTDFYIVFLHHERYHD